MSADPIRTEYWPKPIPIRRFDWIATRDGYDEGDPIGTGATEAEAIADLLKEEEFRAETTPIVARLDGRCCNSAEEAGTRIPAEPERPSPAGHDAGHNRRPQPTGVDNPKCLEKRGGGISENDAAPSLSQNRRVVLSYSGAKVISAYTHIEIELTQAPSRHGLVGELRKGRWVRSADRIWSRENDVAAIASARDILGRFYGSPVE